MLTIQQLVAIETQSSVLPLHVGSLHKKFGPGPLSLSSIIKQVEAKKAVLFVQVRDPSVFNGVTNLEQLQVAWKKSTPSKATLTQLSQILSSRGASIIYLSKDQQTVGIAGTTGSLAGFQVIALTYANVVKGLGDIAQGVMGLGGGLLAIGAYTSAPVLIFVGADLVGFGAGMLFGLGFITLFSGEDTSNAAPPLIESQDGNVYGDTPPDLSTPDILNLPGIDPSTLLGDPLGSGNSDDTGGLGLGDF